MLLLENRVQYLKNDAILLNQILYSANVRAAYCVVATCESCGDVKAMLSQSYCNIARQAASILQLQVLEF